MLNSEFVNSFYFLGYDIRSVKKDEAASRGESGGKLSIDTSISERPDDDAYVKNIEQVSGSFLGLFPTIHLAQEAIDSLPERNQGRYRILAVFLDKASFEIAVAKDLISPRDRVELSQEDIKNQSLLGFDVATLQLEWISFCHNFGFDSGEHLMPIPLNAVGLLDSFETAEQIKLFAEKKVPEHSPFGVWGIASCS